MHIRIHDVGFTKAYAMAVLLIGLLQAAPATEWYVATNGAGVGTSWAVASNNLQGMILNSSVLAGDTIWVSNGLYASGGVTNYPAGTFLTNRIAITKAITLRSKDNDPTNTIIKGNWDPVKTNGPAAVRCVYMASGSTLIGFTLTNGSTLSSAESAGDDDYNRFGGGVFCSSTDRVISNCIITGNSAGGGLFAYRGGGGARGGTLYNCQLIGNRAWGDTYPIAGGANLSILYNCLLAGNIGGGANSCTMSNCTLTGHSGGRAASACTMYNCALIGNPSGGTVNGTMYNCAYISNGHALDYYGGGADYGTMYNCVLISNSVQYFGGGTRGGNLYNCTLIGNSTRAGDSGGGAQAATLYNCTVVGNAGTGVRECNVFNSIVYHNFSTAGTASNWYGAVYFTNSCTIPAVAGWAANNTTNNPAFVSTGTGYGTNHIAGNYRLAGGSPCINVGTIYGWMTNTTDVRSSDLDGRQRIRYGTVDMGAYESIRSGTIYGFR